MAVILADGTKRYEGRVFEKYVDRNYRIMSDVYGTAIGVKYWDGEKIVSQFLWCDMDGTRVPEIIPDASDEVKKTAYDCVFEKTYAAEYEKKAQEIAGTFVEGEQVEVVSGRAAKGRSGKVVKLIRAAYKVGYRNSQTETKALVAFSDEMKDVFVEKYGKTFKNYADAEWVWSRNLKKAVEEKPDAVEIFKRTKALVEKNHPYLDKGGVKIPA